VHETNLAQKQVLGEKIVAHFGGDLTGKKIAVWGLAFKPRTDDIRDAPAIDLIERLLACGAVVSVYDPEAMDNVREIYGSRLTYANGSLEALDGVECLAIVTEWGDFRRPDFDAMASRMRSRLIFDGRNLYAPREMQARGFSYHAIGKAPV
jgi:UDPglucose 6-dehydrogenase